MQAKIERANSLVSAPCPFNIHLIVNQTKCLGGTMIWAIDQDNTDGDSMSDFLGIGSSSGNSANRTKELKEFYASSTAADLVKNSCYWTFCGYDISTLPTEHR